MSNARDLAAVRPGKGAGSVSTNTAVGASALAGSNSGTGYNTAVGKSAASQNTTGSLNAAFGGNALLANTTGASNTAIGTSSVQTNTTGSYNTAVGNLALQANTTANNSTAIGYRALYTSNRTADAAANNTAVGTEAGYSSNASAVKNTFVGIYAGYGNTSGSYNTYVGAQSAAGYGCGELMTTGTKNTIIGGYNGNQGGLDIRTASNYIVLSDGDGNPRATCNGSGVWLMSCVAVPSASAGGAAFEPASDGRVTLKLGTTTTSSTTLQSFWNPNGAVGAISTSGSSTTYSTSSDYRLKNTVAPMTGALAKVAQLKPVTYKWNADGSDGEGFIAHELAEVVPDAVTGAKDAVDADGNPVYQGIDTSFLVATLTAAIQELKAEFDAYKATHP